MSLRATTDHIDYYGREHLFEIYDDQWGGSVTALKNTGRGFGQFSHQVLDPKKPWENPIQKGVLELSVWLSSTDLLDDIKDGDEQQFHIIHKIDSTQEWAGYIYNDLTTYEENILPFRVTLVAKDFTDLGGKDFLVSSSLPDNRETVITTIATLLNEVGFDIPIKTHTSWIEDNITSSQDYLRQINHETKALREFGRTGDESDTAITVEEALNKLCSNHKLILKQTGGAYWIDQLTAYDNPASVQETVYDIDGTLNTAESNVDTTVSANTTDLKVVISSDNRDNSGLPGLKRAKVKFDHRTKVTGIEFESTFTTDDSSNITESQSQFFTSDGNQTIKVETGRIDADFSPDAPQSAYIRVQIQAGSYYWDEDGNQWTSTNTVNEIDLANSINSAFTTGVSLLTGNTPSDADGQLTVTFYNAVDDVEGAANLTIFRDASVTINNAVADENSTSIDYVLTQSGSFSVVEEFEDDWYGDGPIGYAVSALRHGSGDGDTTADSWGRRGQTADKNFHENQLKEPMDVRRGWRRLLTALLKGVYYPHNVLSYDSEFFYYLGGRWDLFTGNFQADLFSLDIVTGSDTFEDIPKFTDETGSGSGSTSGSTGGGLDQSTADARYFKQASLLSEVSAGDLPTLYGNIGLDDGSADLDLGSLDINGATFVDSSRNVSANSIDVSQLEDWLEAGNSFGSGVRRSIKYSSNEWFNLISNSGRAGFVWWATPNDTNDGFVHTHPSLLPIRIIQGGDDIRIEGAISNTGGIGSAVNGFAEIMRFEADNTKAVANTLEVSNTLTINSQLLFTLGNEQLLSTDAGVDFVDLTLTDFLTVGGVSTFNGAIDANSTSNFQGNITTQANIADDGFSDWFSANPAGYEIAGATGVADFRTVFTDELIAKAFTADVAQALAGSDFLTKSVAKVAEDFTIPAVSSSGTLTVEDLEGLEDLQTFESGDWVRIRIVDTTSSPAVIGDVWGQVTSYSDNADGTQDWTFTVDYAGPSDVLAGQTVYKGAIVLDYGVSGDTYIERTVLDRSGGSDFSKVPYDRIVRWTGTDPRTGTKEVLVQSGNINGLGGFSSATYGFFAKDNFVVELDGGNMKLGKNVGGAGVDGIHIDSNDYWYTDGTGSVGDGILNWDASIPEVNISSFTVETNRLYNDTNFNLMEMRSDGSVSRFFIRESTGNFVNMFIAGSSNWGLRGSVNGDLVFELGSTNQIAGINFDDAKLWTGDGTNGYVGLGATSGATDRAFWAGADNADGSGDAAFYVQQNGRVKYEGISTIIIGREEMATFSNNASASSITNEEWETEVTASGGGFNSNSQVKIRKIFTKRFGKDFLICSGIARKQESSSGADHTVEVQIDVSSVNGAETASSSQEILASSNTSFSFSFDISNIPDDDLALCEVTLYADIDNGTLGDATNGYLREDISIVDATNS